MICGKTIYKSKGEAKEAIAGLQRSKRGPRLPNQTYWCEECKGWHLNSPRKKRWRNKTFKDKGKGENWEAR